MNGYTLMAESYRKLMNEGKIEKEVAEKEIRIRLCNITVLIVTENLLPPFIKFSRRNIPRLCK